jgi:hypothetical protein
MSNTIIHVSQPIIRANHKHRRRDPVLMCKSGKENKAAHEVEIKGPCRVIYSPDKPLPCGAKVWIETDAEVIRHIGKWSKA